MPIVAGGLDNIEIVIEENGTKVNVGENNDHNVHFDNEVNKFLNRF